MALNSDRRSRNRRPRASHLAEGAEPRAGPATRRFLEYWEQIYRRLGDVLEPGGDRRLEGADRPDAVAAAGWSL